jgi:hypothetical protein
MKAMAPQRSHSIEFKRQVAQEFIAGESLYALSKRHTIFGVCFLIIGYELSQVPVTERLVALAPVIGDHAARRRGSMPESFCP